MGNELIPRMKTDGSEAAVPLGELLLSRAGIGIPCMPSRTIGFSPTKTQGRTPLSASMMAKDRIRLAVIPARIRLECGQRFGFHNFRHSLATFLINKGKDVKTIQGLLPPRQVEF